VTCLLHTVAEELRAARDTLALTRLVKRTGQSASTLLRELHALRERLGADAGFEVFLDESEDHANWRIRAQPVPGVSGVESLEYYAFDSSKSPQDAGYLPKTPSIDEKTALLSRSNAVAQEAAVALVFNGISHAVLMASPTELEDLACGFAWSEGIVDSPGDVRSAEASQVGDSAWEVRIDISARHFERLKAARRTLAGPSGCGLCGIESLQALDAAGLPRVAAPAWLNDDPATAAAILAAAAQFTDHQPRNAIAGALHAAALCDPQGQIQAAREDVGRHNALDKLLGSQGQAISDGFVLMSSRASVELVRKCARAGAPLLATVSAPTTLAIETAKNAKLQLWGFARATRVLRYA
jgi:FdhD protein